MVSKVTVNRLQLAKIPQTIPDILASNASAQFPGSFWSGQLFYLKTKNKLFQPQLARKAGVYTNMHKTFI